MVEGLGRFRGVGLGVRGPGYFGGLGGSVDSGGLWVLGGLGVSGFRGL